MTMRVYFATDIHGSEVCWRKFLNAGRFYGADILIMGGDVSGKAVVPVVCLPGGGYLVRQLSGDKVLTLAELDQVEAKIRDMGFYPHRTTESELDEIWDSPGRGPCRLPLLDAGNPGPVAGSGETTAGWYRDPALHHDRQR